METNETIRKRVEFFMNEDVLVHIKLPNGKFYNGKVIEVNDDNLILEDRMVGKVFVYFFEILNIEPYKVVGGGI